MTWSPIQPLAARKNNGVTGITVARSKSGGRFKPRVTVAIRLDKVDLPWIKRGVAASVEIGAGKHDGMIRISPGGPHQLKAFSGTASRVEGLLRLCFPPLPGMPDIDAEPTACIFEIEDGALVVDLPAWANPPKPAETKPATALPPPPKLPTAHCAPPSKPFGISGPDHAQVIVERQSSLRRSP